ncbi:Thioesterase domain [Dillenia turbinata]|uniref:Thioesterase domain n=1 Tax=Dillenia turbinata TaxID=194707 RepID=A0AAN8UUW6_9MAGN
MELEGVKKKYLELEKGDSAAILMDSLPHNFFENFVKAGNRVHLIELGRVLLLFISVCGVNLEQRFLFVFNLDVKVTEVIKVLNVVEQSLLMLAGVSQTTSHSMATPDFCRLVRLMVASAIKLSCHGCMSTTGGLYMLRGLSGSNAGDAGTLGVLVNNGGFIHGGAIATLVDVFGSAVILTYGVPTAGVSVDINLSYLDAAFPDVGAVQIVEEEWNIIYLRISLLFYYNFKVYLDIDLHIPSISAYYSSGEKEMHYILEEIEIDAKALHVGKTLGVVSVEFRKKATGKIIAQGRHTKYLAINSKI